MFYLILAVGVVATLVALLAVAGRRDGYARFGRLVNGRPQDLRRAGDEPDKQVPNVGGTRGLNF